ncbi:hypothetical protein QUF90_07415 [Desulfococcaceae bacterium HSG9]|nr:hypothetical protein [Desulfococcaceae bacterium HSG9]
MKNLLSKQLVFAITVIFFTILCSFSVQAAEKKKVTYIKKNIQTISKENIYPSDVPKHKISQSVKISNNTYSDPDFGSSENWSYGQSDSVAGSGTHRGYTVSKFKNGDKTYAKWEGTHKITFKEGGDWEVNIKGDFQWTGGTGKFKNIKGGGVYKGKVTAKGETQEGEFEVEY